MNNPCLTVIKNEIKSIDETMAKEQRYPYAHNRFLRHAIQDVIRLSQTTEYQLYAANPIS